MGLASNSNLQKKKKNLNPNTNKPKNNPQKTPQHREIVLAHFQSDNV